MVSALLSAQFIDGAGLPAAGSKRASKFLQSTGVNSADV